MRLGRSCNAMAFCRLTQVASRTMGGPLTSGWQRKCVSALIVNSPRAAYQSGRGFQWHGERKRRPDLRNSGHLPRGTRGVRIEFEADETQVLLSDFELWHYVLNYWYLPESEADGEAFEAELAKVSLSYYASKPLPDPKYHKRIERSWLRIFDLNWSCDGIASQKEDKSIQTALWELRIESIKKVQEFTAR